MTYTRKTIDEYHIESLYEGEWSTECIEKTRKEAWTQLKCYRENQPKTFFRIKKHRVPIKVKQ